MIKVVLAGQYPEGTYEAVRKLLPETEFSLAAVDTQESYDLMTDAQIMILRIFKAPREVMERNKNLKMILRWGAGYDSVDIKAAGENGILVTNTPGANAGSVSELAVLLMLAVGRKLLSHEACLKRGEWSKNTFLDSSYSLNGKMLGVIGAGNIGRQTADKARAFGARIQYYDEYRLSPEMEKKYELEYTALDDLIATSDIITLHIPLTQKTRHLIGSGQISRMKQGAILINTARGGLVDEKALADAVREGRLLGAGIDCVEEEPLSPDDPLLNTPGIIVTPHIGGGTADIADRIIPMLVEDIEDYAQGKTPRHLVNGAFLN